MDSSIRVRDRIRAVLKGLESGCIQRLGPSGGAVSPRLAHFSSLL
jgi:hypothetical protein